MFQYPLQLKRKTLWRAYTVSANLSVETTTALDVATVAKVNGPTESATGLPNHAYTDPAFFELEREKLFSTTWSCVGQACTVPSPGDARPIGFLGIPLLMIRNGEGEIRVFHNVCSHRGNELVWEACSAKGVLRCPYHSWTYDFDGNLRGTPHVGGPGKHELEGFERERHGLRVVRSVVWMDLVFVNLSGTAVDFDEHIAPLESRLFEFSSADEYAHLKPAKTHGSLEMNLQANWKLCIENNLESYHLPWVHPDLNAISKLEDHYHFYGDELFAGQGSNVYDSRRGTNRPFPVAPGWPDKIAEYPTLFPNAFIGIHCDQFWTMVIEPLSHDRTRERLQLYYRDDSAADDEFEASREANLKGWTKVFNEDIGVVQGMQRGRRSPAFEGGAFSSVMDKPTHHFAKWVANRLA